MLTIVLVALIFGLCIALWHTTLMLRRARAEPGPMMTPYGPVGKGLVTAALRAPPMPGDLEATTLPADGVVRSVEFQGAPRDDVSFTIDRATATEHRVSRLSLNLDQRTIDELGPTGCHDLQHAICGACARLLSAAMAAAHDRKGAPASPEPGENPENEAGRPG